LQVWTTNIKGLSKMVTRIKLDSQVRRCVLAGQGSHAHFPAVAGTA
jgi:hypothetical protein